MQSGGLGSRKLWLGVDVLSGLGEASVSLGAQSNGRAPSWREQNPLLARQNLLLARLGLATSDGTSVSSGEGNELGFFQPDTSARHLSI